MNLKTPLAVASKEFCRELWELTGWEDTYSFHSLSGEDVGWDINRSHTMGGMVLPAYDLGYLMRKLPAFIKESRGQYPLRMSRTKADNYFYRFQYQAPTYGPRYPHVAAEPENAAISLLITLIKKGVVTL